MMPRQMLHPALLVLPALAALVAGCADDGDPKGAYLGDEWRYDLDEYRKVDPALIGYEETAAVATGLHQVRGVAVGPGGRTWVVGDRKIVALGEEGAVEVEIATSGEPRCVTVAPDGTVYAALRERPEGAVRDHVEVYAPDGAKRASWEPLSPKGRITSLAATVADVFVADAGRRIVIHFGADGKSVTEIGRREAPDDDPVFLVPSPYFDVAVEGGGVLWVANPGKWQVEAYGFDGCRGFAWGRAGTDIEGFCGCCNPAQFALTPTGGFVTAEKGLVRVKEYDPDGNLVCVVAPPAAFGDDARVDVAVDAEGRVLVLDPKTARIRVFEKIAGFERPGETR